MKRMEDQRCRSKEELKDAESLEEEKGAKRRGQKEVDKVGDGSPSIKTLHVEEEKYRTVESGP